MQKPRDHQTINQVECIQENNIDQVNAGEGVAYLVTASWQGDQDCGLFWVEFVSVEKRKKVGKLWRGEGEKDGGGLDLDGDVYATWSVRPKLKLSCQCARNTHLAMAEAR